MGINQTMNIGFLSPSVSRSAGGLYDATRYLASGLSSQPNLTMQIFGIGDDYTAADLSGWSGLATQIFDRKGPGFFSYAPRLQLALQEANLDVLHSQGLWMYPSMASSQWAKRTGKPYLISPHGMLDPWAVRNSRWKKRLAGWAYENAHLHGAACLHALCESEAESIRAYGLKNPICVIPNGIHAPPNTISETAFWRQQIPDKAKILLYLGRLHPKKGLLQLLEAWATAHEYSDANTWHLVIAGWDQNGHEQILKALADNLYIQGSVHFIGSQFGGQKHACYSNADAFILPSFSEGLPMTILEAWSYCLPVLMTEHCHLPEGFQANAAIHIGTDADSIKNGLAVLFNMSDSERCAMGERGKMLTINHFSWSHIAKQMTLVYQWVLGEGDKPDCVICD
ncbi:glycosyltransferase [Methylovulum psychrotolerans]|uniref:Glycosyl transferase family 1 n=1 Tax=Methylovulum psychrotolerans TaxID=1704499 RepID=A0A1Z4BWS0_9GAMM|nr:glycosyltransferase [Methylovulum psychrotolerans]ASF45702.1 glycosyl transferase family 1 [Methylovulum psychrotolerans]